jgi:hypothetical protein
MVLSQQRDAAVENDRRNFRGRVVEPDAVEPGDAAKCSNPNVAIQRLDDRFDGYLREPFLDTPTLNTIVGSRRMEKLCVSCPLQEQQEKSGEGWYVNPPEQH